MEFLGKAARQLKRSSKEAALARRLFMMAILMPFLVGCAFARSGEDRFSYTPSVSVKEEDYAHCDGRGRAAAYRAISEVSGEAESVAALTGALGAWLTLEYGSIVEQNAYKEAFESCLQEKGYEIES